MQSMSNNLQQLLCLSKTQGKKMQVLHTAIHHRSEQSQISFSICTFIIIFHDGYIREAFFCLSKNYAYLP